MSDTQKSKQLAFILRHNKDDSIITLDAEGWGDVEIVLKALHIDLETLSRIVENDTKTRYAFNTDKTKIRANYGHSVDKTPAHHKSVPPDILYHGTAERFVDSILKQGLLPQNRQFVHLSSDEETAISVGKRHGVPRVLRIRAKQMSLDGFEFQEINGTWLVSSVPTQYIAFGNNS